jgi:hypothetical protein
MTSEKCIPHGFADCCNVEIPVLDASECLDFGTECDGAVEYRMPMSGSGRSFPRCEAHFEVRLNTQARLSRDYGVPMFYDGSDY